MIEIARRRVPEATFVVGDALELPFDDLFFERVFSSNVCRLLRDPERARFLSEARRVAREVVIGEPTSRFSPGRRAEGFEERVLSDGSRHEIYRRYFEAEGLAKELGGQVLFTGEWFSVVVARP
jgi:ubiquinone/menaquinone biosynthesis C-methylase UbiE